VIADPSTNAARNAAIVELLRRRTAEMVAAGPQACRDHLVSLGIYRHDGSIHEDFGGQASSETPSRPENAA
jgi:hypothetical protein